jgi:hypothetical protein
MIRNIKRFLLNVPGWHTKRKIVVFESDDWGSIRMPSHQVYMSLLNKGIGVDNLSYNKFDSLACEDDLTLLFEVLHSVKDKNGNYPVVTANTIMTNPDFEKIRASDFKQYHWELFTKTLKSYPQHSNSFKLWKEGIAAGVFKPQFHGREHLNVNRWMKALQNNIKDIRTAFDYKMFDLSTSYTINENSFMETLNFEQEEEIMQQSLALAEGLDLFEKVFGYRSSTFIAPCYIWSSRLNNVLKEKGIKSFQGNWWQFEPLAGEKHIFKKRFHFIGQKNNLGQCYTIRNASFEPSENPTFNWIGDVMKRAEIVFRWGKPLIISTHRLNFIGFIDPTNRNRNLPMFSSLLNQLIKKWPDIEFLSSDQLANSIINK